MDDKISEIDDFIESDIPFFSLLWLKLRLKRSLVAKVFLATWEGLYLPHQQNNNSHEYLINRPRGDFRF